MTGYRRFVRDSWQYKIAAAQAKTVLFRLSCGRGKKYSGADFFSNFFLKNTLPTMTMWSKTKTARTFRRRTRPFSSNKACHADEYVICKNSSLPPEEFGKEQVAVIEKTLSAGDASILKMLKQFDGEYHQPDVCNNSSSRGRTESDTTASNSASGEDEIEIAQMPSDVSDDVFDSDDEEHGSAHEWDENVAVEGAVGEEITQAVATSTVSVNDEGITTDETPPTVAVSVVQAKETVDSTNNFQKLENMMMERVDAIKQIRNMLTHEIKLDNGESFESYYLSISSASILC